MPTAKRTLHRRDRSSLRVPRLDFTSRAKQRHRAVARHRAFIEKKKIDISILPAAMHYAESSVRLVQANGRSEHRGVQRCKNLRRHDGLTTTERLSHLSFIWEIIFPVLPISIDQYPHSSLAKGVSLSSSRDPYIVHFTYILPISWLG